MLAGCLGGPDSPGNLAPRGGTARYESSDGRVLWFSLAGPAKVLGPTNLGTDAYELRVSAAPSMEPFSTSWIGHDWLLLRTDTPCLESHGGECVRNRVSWTDFGEPAPLGIGLNQNVDAAPTMDGAPVPVAQRAREIGSEITLGAHVPRLLGAGAESATFEYDQSAFPLRVTWALSEDDDVTWHRTGYEAGPWLSPAAKPPTAAQPSVFPPDSYMLFPGDDADDLRLGVSHREPFEYLLAAEAGAQRLFESGCMAWVREIPDRNGGRPAGIADLGKATLARFTYLLSDGNESYRWIVALEEDVLGNRSLRVVGAENVTPVTDCVPGNANHPFRMSAGAGIQAYLQLIHTYQGIPEFGMKLFENDLTNTGHSDLRFEIRGIPPWIDLEATSGSYAAYMLSIDVSDGGLEYAYFHPDDQSAFGPLDN